MILRCIMIIITIVTTTNNDRNMQISIVHHNILQIYPRVRIINTLHFVFIVLRYEAIICASVIIVDGPLLTFGNYPYRLSIRSIT